MPFATLETTLNLHLLRDNIFPWVLLGMIVAGIVTWMQPWNRMILHKNNGFTGRVYVLLSAASTVLWTVSVVTVVIIGEKMFNLSSFPIIYSCFVLWLIVKTSQWIPEMVAAKARN